MSSDEDEVEMLCQYLRGRNRKRRRYWIHSSFQVLKNHGASICAKELKAHPTQFQNCYRMSPDTFSTVVDMLAPYITKQDTNYRDAITPQEKLLITLRYLATGCSFKALTHIFIRGDTTIGLIVKGMYKGYMARSSTIVYACSNRGNWEVDGTTILRTIGSSKLQRLNQWETLPN